MHDRSDNEAEEDVTAGVREEGYDNSSTGYIWVGFVKVFAEGRVSPHFGLFFEGCGAERTGRNFEGISGRAKGSQNSPDFNP